MLRMLRKELSSNARQSAGLVHVIVQLSIIRLSIFNFHRSVLMHVRDI